MYVWVLTIDANLIVHSSPPEKKLPQTTTRSWWRNFGTTHKWNASPVTATCPEMSWNRRESSGKWKKPSAGSKFPSPNVKTFSVLMFILNNPWQVLWELKVKGYNSLKNNKLICITYHYKFNMFTVTCLEKHEKMTHFNFKSFDVWLHCTGSKRKWIHVWVWLAFWLSLLLCVCVFLGN